MSLGWKPCQLVTLWLMPLTSEHCHTGGCVFMVAEQKIDWQNLILMTWLETLSVGSYMVNGTWFGALSHCVAFMVAK